MLFLALKKVRIAKITPPQVLTTSGSHLTSMVRKFTPPLITLRKTMTLFYQPFPFYEKNQKPPPFFENFKNSTPPFIKGEGGFQLCTKVMYLCMYQSLLRTFVCTFMFFIANFDQPVTFEFSYWIHRLLRWLSELKLQS